MVYLHAMSTEGVLVGALRVGQCLSALWEMSEAGVDDWYQ